MNQTAQSEPSWWGLLTMPQAAVVAGVALAVAVMAHPLLSAAVRPRFTVVTDSKDRIHAVDGEGGRYYYLMYGGQHPSTVQDK